MQGFIIDFYPPIVGLEDEFNTVRLGVAWKKRLAVGEEVYLSDNKERKVIGKAIVTDVQTGRLDEICASHADKNHSQLSLGPAGSMERLFAIIQKLYGPHLALPEKKATVIYLKRLP